MYPSIYEHILLIFSVATLVVKLIEWTANKYCAYYQKLRHDVFRLSNTFPVENQGFIMKSWKVSSLACLRWDRVGLEKDCWAWVREGEKGLQDGEERVSRCLGNKHTISLALVFPLHFNSMNATKKQENPRIIHVSLNFKS